jgi:hypothetical protein
MESGRTSSSLEHPVESFDVVQALTKAFDRRHLAHALFLVNQGDPLFRARVGTLIKNIFCFERFKNLLSKPCGYCDSCLILSEPTPSVEDLLSRFEAANLESQENIGEPSGPLWLHPDFFWIFPENSKGYSVDQIRALQNRLSLKPSLSDIRVAWIENAEQLSASGGASANALLKILEEPRPQTFIILSTAQAGGVMQTLQSRCQKYIFWNSSGEKSQTNDFAGWEKFSQWVFSGAKTDEMTHSLPPDRDSFWKDREAALKHLNEAYECHWKLFTGQLSHMDRQMGLRAMDVFSSFEELIRALKQFGQPQLQWLNFRESGRLGFAKDAHD